MRLRFRRLPKRVLSPDGAPWDESERPLDVDVLKLLLDTTEHRSSNWSFAVEEYARVHGASTKRLPDFAEASARGWFRRLDDDMLTARALDEFLRYDYPAPEYGEELRQFMYGLYEPRYEVASPGKHGSASIMESWLLGDQPLHERPRTQTPSWIAARLWDSVSAPTVSTWAARWEVLFKPVIIPELAWPKSLAQSFRESVLDYVQRADLPGWDAEEIHHAIVRTGDARNAASTRETPHLLGRYLQIAKSANYRSTHEVSRATDLLRPLIAELPVRQSGPVPSATATALGDLAQKHPDILQTLVDGMHRDPEALADLLLCPSTATLVTYMVATWPSAERPGDDSMAAEVQLSLLIDCMSVLTRFVQREEVDVDEFALLLVALEELDNGHRMGETMLSATLSELQNAFAPIKSAVIDALLEQLQPSPQDRRISAFLRVLSTTGKGLSASQLDKIAGVYRDWLSTTERHPTADCVDTTAAAALMHAAISDQKLPRKEILYPLDVSAHFALGKNENGKLGQALREHIRVLSRGIVGYPEEVPDSLVQALADAVSSGAGDRPSKNQVDAFDFELAFLQRQPSKPIEQDLLAAVNRLESASQQKQLCDALKNVQEPLVLAALVQGAPRQHRDGLKAKLSNLNPASASQVYFFPHMQRRVDALMDLGMTELAIEYIEDLQRCLVGRTTPTHQVMLHRSRIQLAYLKGDSQAISEAVVPKGLPSRHEQEALQVINFYKPLVLLRDSPSQMDSAVAAFSDLNRRQPSDSTAINLLSARTTRLLKSNLYSTLQGEGASLARLFIREADAAIPHPQALTPRAQIAFTYNVVALLLATGQTEEAMRRIRGIGPSLMNSEILVFESVAYYRLGDQDRAHALITKARQEFGDVEEVISALNYMLHREPATGKLHLRQSEESLSELRSAFLRFQHLPPERQAEVLYHGTSPLEAAFTELFRDAISALSRSIVFMMAHRNNYHEDDYNGILGELVQARVDTLFGWQAHEQSPGGYTETGRFRRRDIVFRRRSVDIAALEALKSKQPNDRRIVDHLHKLLSYTNADIFVHLTYSLSERTDAMLEGVKRAARMAPPGTRYLNLRPIPREGDRPEGARAAYRRGDSDVVVLFFVVDVLQANQRMAGGAPPAKTSSS